MQKTSPAQTLIRMMLLRSGNLRAFEDPLHSVHALVCRCVKAAYSSSNTVKSSNINIGIRRIIVREALPMSCSGLPQLDCRCTGLCQREENNVLHHRQEKEEEEEEEDEEGEEEEEEEEEGYEGKHEGTCGVRRGLQPAV